MSAAVRTVSSGSDDLRDRSRFKMFNEYGSTKSGYLVRSIDVQT